MFFAKTYAAVCGLSTLSSAHMIMANPKPFAGVQQGPLERDGSNYPCQNTGGAYQSQGTTTMAKGAPQELAFIGQAVHGGGSCQVSITYDTAPTKNSVWKVIHSIQGGCPAKNQAGNMGGDATAPDPYTYQFQIPDGVPTGNATVAWTWLNRIGNREYYMNCAPISITGGAGDKSNFDSLPDMVVANIPAITTCSTDGLDNSDYRYPNPGTSVDNFNMTTLVDLKGNCGPVGSQPSSGSGSSGGSGSGPGSGSGSGGSPPPPPFSSPAPPVQAPTTSPAKDSPTLPGGVFFTVPNGGAPSNPPAAPTQASQAPSSQAAQPTQAPPATTKITPTTFASVAKTSPVGTSTAAAATPASGSSGNSGSGSGSAAGTGAPVTPGSACTPEGLWNCVGGHSYQRCGSGTWTPVMALAAGMECTPGQSTTLEMKAINGKVRRRLARFSS